MSQSVAWDPVKLVSGILAFLSLTIVVGILFFLIGQSFPIFQLEGGSFLWGRDWFPDQVYGALPMIYGSLMVTGLALFLALPFAVASAVFSAEFLPNRIRLIVKGMMELFAGVPGIVYGLVGVSFLANLVKDIFGLMHGNTIATAGLLLAVMILPTIMTLSEDAIRAVPGEYREEALSLGFTQVAVVFRSVLPQAVPGIAGAVFLGLGRAMGETIAVMLVIGGLDRVPNPWFNLFSPAQSIPSKLGREAAEAFGSDLHWNALMGLGLILFLLVTALALVGNVFLKKVR